MRSVKLGESQLIARHIVALNTTGMPARLCLLSVVDWYVAIAVGSHASKTNAAAVACMIDSCCVRNEMIGVGSFAPACTLRRIA